MPSKNKKSLKPPWLQSIFIYSRIQSLFSEYLKLPLFFVPAHNLGLWYTLVGLEDGLRPLNFELFYGKKHARLAYNEINLQKALKTGRAVLGNHAGLSDLFVPVGKAGVLVAGSFLRELPQRSTILKHWKSIKSLKTVVVDDELLHYTRLLCEAPVLDAKLLSELTRLLTLVGKQISASIGGNETEGKIDKLNSFYSRLPARMWKYVAVKRHRLFWGAYQGVDLAEWDQKEWGLTRSPDTVIALAPRDTKGDSLDKLLFCSQLQRGCFDWVKGLAQTICGPLGQQGVFFLTASDKTKGSVQAGLALKDLALKILEQMQRVYGGVFSVGVGSTTSSGQDLPASFRQAVMSLQLAQHQGKPLLFFKELEVSASEARPHPFELADKMVTALAKGSSGELDILRDQYVEEVLLIAGEELAVLKAHVSTLLLGLLKIAVQRSLKSPADHRAFRNRLLKELETAQTVHEAVGLLHHWLGSCRTMMLSAARGRQHLVLEDLARHLRADLSHRVSLAQAALQAGMSTTHFSRSFKKQFGSSYAHWMLRQRCEEACRALRHSTLAIHQIAQACGFGSPSYFVQAFQKELGLSPSRFRENSKN